MHTPRTFDPSQRVLSPTNVPGYGIDNLDTRPVLEPIDRKITHPGTYPSGEVLEKIDVFPQELKQPHPWILRSPQINEPSDQSRTMWANVLEPVRKAG